MGRSRAGATGLEEGPAGLGGDTGALDVWWKGGWDLCCGNEEVGAPGPQLPCIKGGAIVEGISGWGEPPLPLVVHVGSPGAEGI